MVRRFLVFFSVLLACVSSSRAAEPVTLTSLLAEMVDRDAIARLPAPRYSCLQASSYDRAQTDPHNPKTWFANHDYEQFIRTETNEGRKEWVIMEHTGPGAIVRFWTPLDGGRNKQIIRFYFDGAATPAITANFNDLMRGRLFAKAPFAFIATDEKAATGVAGDLYLPIPFAKGCKITLDSLPFYYNINYRAYETGTEVKTFTIDNYERSAADLKKCANSLKEKGSVLKGWGRGVKESLSPGEKTTRDLPAGNGAVTKLHINFNPKSAPESLRSLVLEVTFDGETTVWCPLSEFFGCGAKLHSVDDWNRSAKDDGHLIALWDMPYRNSARVAIENLGKKPVDIDWVAFGWKKPWDDRSMHFHAAWRHQYPIETKKATGTMDWNYLEAKGQGVYVGDTLTVFSPVKAWYGEGDERVYVDGEIFPSHLGTGTEDYYGYAWGMAHEFSSPFLSMPRRDSTGRGDWRGYTTTSRVRLLDGIPFERSLKFDMEIWDWAATKLDYSAATFWYARPGATCNRDPQPDDAAKPLSELPHAKKLAGVVECEAMKVVNKSHGLPVETQSDILEWSGDTQLFVHGRRVGDFVELRIPSAATKLKTITLYATKSWDYGILRFTINGQPAGKDFDAYSAESVLSEPIDLGKFEPQDGQYILRVEVVGSNPSARGTKAYFGLDAVQIQ